MKNEDLTMLLQTILEDVTAIRIAINPNKHQSSIGNEKNAQLVAIQEELQSIKESISQSMGSSQQAIDQQRVIDLKIQLDRIAARITKEDKLINYFFAPGVILWTLFFSFLIFVSGLIADRVYVNYKSSQEELHQFEYDGR